jgi:hypothetical protein
MREESTRVGPESVRETPPAEPPFGEVRNTGRVGRVRRSMQPRRAVALFLPSLVVASGLCGLIYVVAQQELRTAANDPQEQLARQAAIRLDGGSLPTEVIGPTTVDVGTSLAPFVVVYDSAGNVLATDGALDGKAPMLPGGVLATATKTGRNAVTWQPRDGVRIATVTFPWNGGTVTSGRSLQLADDRESSLRLTVVAAWIATVFAVALASVAAAWLWPQTPGLPVKPSR